MNTHLLVALITFLFTTIVATSGEAETVIFTKIADTTTTIPGTTVTFTNFGSPAIDGNNVSFWGGNGSDRAHAFPQGIFLTTIGQSLQFIVQRDVTEIPDAPLVNNVPQTFTRFGDPAISNGQVAFAGQNPFTPVNQGNYVYSSGSVIRIVDQQIGIPGGSGTFSKNEIGSPWINNGDVVFFGGDNLLQEGVYSYSGGSLQMVADLGTPIPDGSGDLFSAFRSQPAIVNGTKVFLGHGPNGKEGIYTSAGGTLSTVVDTNTLSPDTGTAFPTIWSFGFDGTTVAFTSDSPVYKVSSSGIQLVADQGIVSPLIAPMSFTNFTSPVINSGNIAFLGHHPFAFVGGLFAEINGVLTKILASNDPLDGKIVKNSTTSPITLGRMGISGTRVAFVVRFMDNTAGMYVTGSDSQEYNEEKCLGLKVNPLARSLRPLPPLLCLSDAPGCFNATLGIQTACVVTLTSGSEASLSQLIDTPATPTPLTFDYIFQTATGQLKVLLGGTELLSIPAPATAMSELSTASVLIDGALLNQTGLVLELLFDGPTDSVVQVDNVVFNGVANGDFQTGDLQGWIATSSGTGAIAVLPTVTGGDLNGDDLVDDNDLGVFLSLVGLCAGDAGYTSAADGDGDNCVTSADEAILYADTDGEGFRDYADNCILVANTDQRDTDGDGYGNICDPDFNGNGIVDPTDFSVLKAVLGQFGHPDEDLNGNTIVDPTDFSILKANLGQPPGPSCCAP